MEEKLCEYCGKSFKAYKKAERRFCGKECWYSSIRGKKVGKYSKERVDAIVAAKKYYYFKRLKNEEVILRKMIKEGYILSLKRYSEELKIPPQTVKKLLNKINPWEEKEKIKLPDKIQLLSFEDYLFYKKKVKEIKYREDLNNFSKKYPRFKKGTLNKWIHFMRGTPKEHWGKNAVPLKHPYSNKQTTPEKKVEEILKEFKIPYEEEVILKRKDPRLFYRIDFVLGNKIAVEVHGDYWHGNPEVFKEEELNETQLNNKKRDIDKMKLMKKEYPEVMVIWEGDLKKNLKKQKGKIYEKYYNKNYV